MALTTKVGQGGNGSKYPKEIKGKVVASIVPNPNNVDECILVFPKEFVKDFGYADYYQLGYRPVKRN